MAVAWLQKVSAWGAKLFSSLQIKAGSLSRWLWPYQAVTANGGSAEQRLYTPCAFTRALSAPTHVEIARLAQVSRLFRCQAWGRSAAFHTGTDGTEIVVAFPTQCSQLIACTAEGPVPSQACLRKIYSASDFALI